mmetsp:Transcript_23356/g.43377  ORF Transcript_23356/g.43377 Transcript_23356/m.43377 type:complete len:221 (+) Transcript_23356:230-892(+)
MMVENNRNFHHCRVYALLSILASTTFLISVTPSSAFIIPTWSRPANLVGANREKSPVCREASTMTRSGELLDSWSEQQEGEEPHNDNDEVDEEDIEFLFEEPEVPYEDLDAMEKVWRHAKKPLLRIGGKGATHSHGNSLRQLLDDHTVVKVKVNTKKFGTLQNAFETLRDLAIENGASPDIELIQMREKDKIILFGLPGTLDKMKDGSFPPPPPPSSSSP